MEFGIGKFLEMFEERFGRRPTTALLLIIAIGIGVFMLKLTFDNAIRPLADGMEQIGGDFDYRELVRSIIVTVGVGLVGSLLMWVILSWQRRRLQQATEAILDRASQAVEATRVEGQAIINSAEAETQGIYNKLREAHEGLLEAQAGVEESKRGLEESRREVESLADEAHTIYREAQFIRQSSADVMRSVADEAIAEYEARLESVNDNAVESSADGEAEGRT